MLAVLTDAPASGRSGQLRHFQHLARVNISRLRVRRIQPKRVAFYVHWALHD